MKRLIIFFLVVLTSSCYALEYIGNYELCFADTQNNIICLNSSDNFTLAEDNNYYVTINYQNYDKNITSITKHEKLGNIQFIFYPMIILVIMIFLLLVCRALLG